MTTIQDILAAEARAQAEFEAQETYKGHTVAALRQAFELVQRPDWKAPFAVAVHHSLVGILLTAVEYFHGRMPRVVGLELGSGLVRIEGDGYAC